MASSGHGNSLMTNHGDDVVYISVMLDADSNMQSAVENWASSFNINHPVLGDPSKVTSPFVTFGYPTFVIVGRDMVIQNADLWPYDENYILSLF